MEEIVNHEKIDTLLQAVVERKTQSPNRPSSDHAAVACNFQRSGTLTSEQVQAIRSLHDTFARTLINSLGAYFSGKFEIAVVSVEQIAYSDFLERIPDPNFACSIALRPLEALAAVELDLPLALPIVDMLLGGIGTPASEVREVTDIEEEILGSVVQLICRDLEAAWLRILNLEFRLLRRQKHAQMLRLMSPKEKVLTLSLEIRTAEVRGMVRLAFPAVVANALLRKLEEQGEEHGEQPGEEQGLDGVATDGSSDNHHLRKVLERCRFHAELLLPDAAVSARKLIHLKVGEVLEFPIKATVPVLFKVENQIFFLAHPVAVGERRAAEMHKKAVTDQLIKEESN